MPWVSANDLPCGAPPTNRGCGVVEYPDEDEDNRVAYNKRKHYSQKVPDKETLEMLYYDMGMSLKRMQMASVRYFGAYMGYSKLSSYMKKYGMALRDRQDPLYSAKRGL